ncbi:MAG: type II toxin-antitoxin system VapC family toxin [Acidobacteriota bacterium]
MRRRVYLETTIISYLTARPSRSVLSAAHQQITIEWWERRRQHFDLLVSELVLREAEAGNPEAARRRLEILAGLPRLALTEDAVQLAGDFMRKGLLPEKAAEDGLHIAIATAHDVDYLLTWNCAHIANPEIQERLAKFLFERGLVLPFICTPEELLGGQS